MNTAIILSYDGTAYHGWQTQRNASSVQQTVTEALASLLGRDVSVSGVGRTDAGVHAAGQVANFKTRSEMSCVELLENLNHYLPEDIGVISIEEVDARFHSRLNAVRKTYRYHIWNSPVHAVFDRRYTWSIEQHLDVPAMRRAAAELIGTHDYKAFSSIKRGKKSTVRTIEAIEIEQTGADITISFTGNGFLYHMVRILTGTLVEVGLHKKTQEDMQAILASLNREQAGVMAPAQGLFLVNVEYS